MTTDQRIELLRGELGTVIHVTMRDRKTHKAMPAVWRIAQVAMDRLMTCPDPGLQLEGLQEGLAQIVAVCLDANGSRNTSLAYVLDVCEQALERIE